MKKRIAVLFILILVLALVFAGFYSCKKDTGIRVIVENQLEVDLHELYLMSAGADSWGNSFVTQPPLYHGGKMKITLDSMESVILADLYGVDSQGTGYLFCGLTLGDDAVIELHTKDKTVEAVINSAVADVNNMVITGTIMEDNRNQYITPVPMLSNSHFSAGHGHGVK